MTDAEHLQLAEEDHANGANNNTPAPDSPSPLRESGTFKPEPAMATAVPQTFGPLNSLSTDQTKAMDQVMHSDVGVQAMLTRLKQSISTARDLAAFLKKRSSMEDDHSKEMRRLCRTTFDGIKSRESRQGSYGLQLEEVVRVHERMSENEMAFGLNLHQMSADLDALAHDVERGRKQWKTTGLSAEHRVQEAERMLDKAKQKYDSLAEDYDHAKTGEKLSGRIGFRTKSGPALEEDLQRKLNTADQDYQGKVQNAQQLRQELVSSSRPQTVQALLQLIKECDSGVTLQLQKFAAFNEKLLLGNGLLISPLNDSGDVQRKSLRDVIGQIDNDKDFHSYVTSLPVPTPRENKYEKHHTLVQHPKPAQPVQPVLPVQPVQPPAIETSASQQSPSRHSAGPQHPQQSAGVVSPVIPTQNFQPFDPLNDQPPPQTALHQQSQQPPYPADNIPPHGPPGRGYPHPAGQQPPYGQTNYGSSAGFGQRQGPPGPGAPYGAGPHGPGPTSMLMGGAKPGPARTGPNPAHTNPVFGVHLNELFVRDASPVPMVIYQCIQAVDLFGLDFEGIYRVSGNANHVAQLRSQFDSDAQQVDFRDPEGFFHDVNNPANLLKAFLRELPDPLLTNASYHEFLDAANVPDDIARRDRLHAAINGLPDPNYATLRSVVLHLHRVIQHERSNRMNANSLAVIFAPTLMGPHSGPVSEPALQHRAIETILTNAMQIFDED